MGRSAVRLYPCAIRGCKGVLILTGCISHSPKFLEPQLIMRPEVAVMLQAVRSSPPPRRPAKDSDSSASSSSGSSSSGGSSPSSTSKSS